MCCRLCIVRALSIIPFRYVSLLNVFELCSSRTMSYGFFVIVRTMWFIFWSDVDSNISSLLCTCLCLYACVRARALAFWICKNCFPFSSSHSHLCVIHVLYIYLWCVGYVHSGHTHIVQTSTIAFKRLPNWWVGFVLFFFLSCIKTYASTSTPMPVSRFFSSPQFDLWCLCITDECVKPSPEIWKFLNFPVGSSFLDVA